MITLIAARARDGAIGKDNTIPWHAPEDLKAFQRETLGGAIVMGRRTWDSLPFKPLKNRLNIVVSSDPAAADTVCASIGEAIDMAYAQGYRRVYGIGGAGIYAAMMGLADRLLITEVDVAVEGADTFFPNFSEADWNPIGTTALRTADPACALVEYLRR
ncbi:MULTISPECIES: dihydrofolate reductase [Rhodobacterales]|uniref:dihydrofolate reductase n=1 Tax=Rhodobacterales TaxID=204455 RepID=UPI00237F501A|nr:dihydrofolate reductase [Phaeobacter gallaeciensis]MDE4098710.1 dihydrofolate reductase [Phaeobacter gallaeciensis]MDE4107533.1 dihydrofolate reductase [Phaeobacter gallaeciensis]MDE4111987.1 dihydrofolate reductase [Phaeobacter gallaeciensis]MDE4116445.1 dihydrofolate reductase [Phaeobacter gallaeciensis]MDE4120916.1 dihydrofolate reductase [Phaeobacter gallaeciensis]